MVKKHALVSILMFTTLGCSNVHDRVFPEEQIGFYWDDDGTANMSAQGTFESDEYVIRYYPNGIGVGTPLEITVEVACRSDTSEEIVIAILKRGNVVLSRPDTLEYEEDIYRGIAMHICDFWTVPGLDLDAFIARQDSIAADSAAWRARIDSLRNRYFGR